MTPAQIQDVPKQFPTIKEMTGWVYGAIKDRAYGDIITYAELGEILTVSAQGRGRAAVLRAGKLMLEDPAHPKLLLNLVNKGYQIAYPREHVGQSQRFQKAALRRANRALAVVIHVALEALAPDERAKVILEQARTGVMVGFQRRLMKQKELPPKAQIALPTGKKLVAMMTRRDRRPVE